jgi:broad specificity phosphatase PhoE
MPITRTARLLLVRHGETQWHAENRYAGASDVPLTARGLRQAAALGEWATGRRPAAVVCSPLSRARLTAEPAARALGMTAQIVPGLREVDFGWAEGRTIGELRAERPEAVEAFLADAERGAFPDSEPAAIAAKRAVTALREVAGANPGEEVLVVSHNTLLRIALCELLGIPIGRYRLVFPRLDNTAVTEVDLGPETAALRAFNVPTGGAR